MTRPVKVTVPGGAELEFHAMSGREELGRLFEYQVELVGTDGNLDFHTLIGKRLTVERTLPDESSRFWNGVITRAAHLGSIGEASLYRLTLRPWLWLLTRTADCKIFQEKKVPDIIKEIFREHGLTDFEEKLEGSYQPREYTVQYRETDFDFVSRLMESEGIYYYFTHADGKHTLVLADAPSAHATISGYDEVPYYPRDEEKRRKRDYVDSWSFAEQMEPGAYVLDDFDFEKPKAELEVKRASQHKLADKKHEIYDYPGGYLKTGAGEAIAKLRVEELYAGQAVAQGEGDAGGLAAGALFKLTGFPREDQNKQYLITSTAVQLVEAGQRSGREDVGDQFHVELTAIDGTVPFRPARTTRRPVVQGPQTAVVVGKSGEEIWTDEHGRVKLQFHWDRLGKADEKSSCWVRVAQLWAGSTWGGIHIPRIGQEVIVEFLEGDPDRPIVTGRVYNGVNKPPYALPANQTQSGIKSRSTKDGSSDTFNELRFEDKKDAELVFFQAQKDHTVNVKNDETITIGHDRKKTIKNDETTLVEGKRTETVKKDETITIEGQRTETVKKDETITIEGKRTETVKKDETITVEGARKETVKKDETITIEGARKTDVTKDETVGITGKRAVKITKDDALEVTGKITVKANQEMTITVGASSIAIKPDGITIKAPKVTIEGQAQVQVKAAQVQAEAQGMAAVKSSGVLMLEGASIMMK